MVPFDSVLPGTSLTMNDTLVSLDAEAAFNQALDLVYSYAAKLRATVGCGVEREDSGCILSWSGACSQGHF